MSARDLLTRLRTLGAQVWTTGPDTLHYRCPADVLTPDLVASLKAAKPEIIALCTIVRISDHRERQDRFIVNG